MMRIVKLWGPASVISVVLILANCSGYRDQTGIRGDYFGQTPPDSIPALFAPGVISDGMNNRDMAFSPSGDLLFYSIWLPERSAVLMFARRTGDVWAQPEIAPFSGKYSDVEPCFSPDGRRLYFASNRPLDSLGNVKDYDIWYVDISDNGWQQPQNLGQPVNSDLDEFYPSLTSNGDLFFTAALQGSEDIVVARMVEGRYSMPERLSDAINTERGEFNALIAPDESYLIFSSHGRKDDMGGGDLYISFRRTDGSWTEAKNMSSPINSIRLDYCPGLSSDGKYFFFTSSRLAGDILSNPSGSFDDIKQKFQSPQNGYDDIYWVDAGIIDKLQKQ